MTEFDPTEKDLDFYRLKDAGAGRGGALRWLKIRLVVLQVLNTSLHTTLPLIDFSVRGDVSRLAGLVRQVRQSILGNKGWNVERGLEGVALQGN